ncbi:hypothetical protein ACFYO7_13360 [Nocardia salmonicida]|uniref:hypothetical protein n=1 Tax=Nocardia salmonicida TaxID=53431 RepID=UPI0036A520F4
MRSTVPTLGLLMAAVLLTGCGYVDRGRDQAEHDSWSRKIETAIRALPGVTDASHRFEHYKGRHFTAELDVQLRDDVTPAEAASVVSAMGAQPLPRRFDGDPIAVTIDRMADSYSAYWMFGRDVSMEANAANNWARLWAAGTEVHWDSSGGFADRITNAIDIPFFARVSVYDPPLEGRTLGVTVFPPVGTEFSAAQTTQLADLHLPYLAGSGAVVAYTIHTPNGPVYSMGPFFEVVVGGCQTPGYNVLPESQPYVRQYEHC